MRAASPFCAQCTPRRSWWSTPAEYVNVSLSRCGHLHVWSGPIAHRLPGRHTITSTTVDEVTLSPPLGS